MKRNYGTFGSRYHVVKDCTHQFSLMIFGVFWTDNVCSWPIADVPESMVGKAACVKLCQLVPNFIICI
jgi:hypothetical protein